MIKPQKSQVSKQRHINRSILLLLLQTGTITPFWACGSVYTVWIMFYNAIMHEVSIYCRMLWLQLYGEMAPCSDTQSNTSGTRTQHLNVWSNMRHNNHFTLIMLFLWSWDGKVIIDIETGWMAPLYPCIYFFICTIRETIRWWLFFCPHDFRFRGNNQIIMSQCLGMCLHLYPANMSSSIWSRNPYFKFISDW